MDPHPMELPWDDEYWQVVLEQGECPGDGNWEPEVSCEAWGGDGTDDEAGADEGETGTNGGLQDPGDSVQEAVWIAADRLFRDHDTIDLPVVGFNRGGLLVQWDQLQGFVPASHLIGMPRSGDADVRRSYLASRVGDTLTLTVVEIDRSRERLVLSERKALQSEVSSDLLAGVSAGTVRKGRISTVCDFGAFVDLGGIEGLIHISELCWGRVNHPSDLVKVGQEVEVLVLSTDPRSRKVALSLRQLQPDPWLEIDNALQVGQLVSGCITNVVSFGAFVKISEGIEGLIHVTELGEGTFTHPRSVLREGEEILARVVSVDGKNHRLGLSLRQVHADDAPGTLT